MEHIPFQKLIDYACDRIAERQEEQAIRTHVNLCSECRQALAIAWQIAQRAHTPEVRQPSPALMQRVLKATRNYYSGQIPTHLPIALLHDSKLDAGVSETRGTTQDRELLFSFGRFDLHISILHTEREESYTLLGQLLTGDHTDCDIEGSCIELHQAGVALRTVLTDDLGRFRISHISEGEYGLQVRTNLVQTFVESLSVQR